MMFHITKKNEITGRINTVVDKNCELVDFGGIYKIKPEGGKTKLIYSEDFLYANEVVREENLVPDLLAENWISLVKEAHESPLKNITDSVYDYDDVQRETDTLLEHIRGITNQETGQIGIGNPAALSKYISKLKLGLEQAIPQKGEGLRRGDLINELVAIQESLYGPFDDAERA